MNKVIIIKIGAVLSLMLLLLITFMFIYAYSTPTQSKEKVIVYSYRLRGDYEYNVSLRPNLLFTSTHLENPKLAFLKISNLVNISYTFNILSNGRINDLRGVIKTLVVGSQPGVWNKTLVSLMHNFTKVPTAITLSLNITNTTMYLSNISRSVGLLGSKYEIKVINYAEVTFIINGFKVHESFPTTLTISINKQVNTVKFTKSPNVKEVAKPTYKLKINYMRFLGIVASVKYFRDFSLILMPPTAALSIGLVLTYLLRFRRRKSLIEKILVKYEDMIVDINMSDKVNLGSSKALVKVRDFNEVIKLAEGLGKPILHVVNSNGKHVFYVNDLNITYTFEA